MNCNTKMAKHEIIPQLEIIDCSNSAIADLISDAENILGNIPEYAEIISESRFRNIKAYGTIDNPCIQAGCIFDYLFPRYLKNYDTLDIKEKEKMISNRNRQYTRWIKNNFTDKDTIGINGDIYMAKIKSKNDDNRYHNNYVLTETGMLVALCSHSENEKLALTFRQHLVRYIRNIRQFHYDICIAEREKSIKQISNQLEEEIKRCEILDAANFSMTTKIMEQHQITNIMLNDDDPSDSDMKELAILREMFMKPLYVYIVSQEYIMQLKADKTAEKKKDSKKETKRKPKKKNQLSEYGMSDDSDESVENCESDENDCFKTELSDIDYNHMSINIRDLEQDPTKLYYMFLSKTKLKENNKQYKWVHTLRIYNKNESDKSHYKNMIEIIKKGSISEFPEKFEIPETLPIMTKSEFKCHTKNMSEYEVKLLEEKENSKKVINAKNKKRMCMYDNYVKDTKYTSQKEEEENIVEIGVKISSHQVYEISYETLVNARNLAFTRQNQDKLSTDFKTLVYPFNHI